MKLDITFPHPDRILSPNGGAPLTTRGAKGHAMAKMGIKMKTRDSAFVRAMQALNTVPQRNFPAKQISITWFFKYGVEPDFDNIVGQVKPLIDGCAQAFGINDRELVLGRVRRVKTKDAEQGKTVVLQFDTDIDPEWLVDDLINELNRLRAMFVEVKCYASEGAEHYINAHACCRRINNLLDK